MARIVPAFTALGLSLLLGACASTPPPTGGGATAGGEVGRTDVIHTLIADGRFHTLLAALDAAELTGTLEGTGPFTVFAPTDQAFAALPEGMLENLMRPDNREQLIAVLSFHVVEGRVPSAELAPPSVGPTLQGDDLPVEATQSGVRIGGARIVEPDVACTNGVVHVIDSVLLP